ncbi:hypothetical protein E3P77_02344 [Wallemia ichthyophaga]|nr:hypothetical protein E3P77_02344 [Wallemia ichthyophaga]
MSDFQEPSDAQPHAEPQAQPTRNAQETGEANAPVQPALPTTHQEREPEREQPEQKEQTEQPEQFQQSEQPEQPHSPHPAHSDKATQEKVNAMSIMFPSIDKEIIISVLESSSSQERAVEKLLQMSDPTHSTHITHTAPKPARPVSQMRQMDDDEALARRLQAMDFERNGRASSTPYDDLAYEPRKPRRRNEREYEEEHQKQHEKADSLEPGFNFSDIASAFSELAWTSKKHLNDFWSSMTNYGEQEEGQPKPTPIKLEDPYAHHYDPAIHRRAKENNRQSMSVNSNGNDKSADFTNLGFLPRREIDLSQHKRNNSTPHEEEEDEYTHNPFNERK